jgi:hypothetical protein
VIEFKFGWWRRHRCIVYQWYKGQQRLSRDQGLSMRFTTIRHCQTLDYPFFHEFLLIPLSDGSAYRVERTGVGSNADAISRSGCTAMDMVQWLPKDKYRAFMVNGTWKLVSEIDFPREFGVRDVLAICYSIQTHETARRYSLQRYNCYFFCCTIISILARRCVRWESMFTEDLWESLLEGGLDQLSADSAAFLTDKTDQPVLFQLCTCLYPENPHAVRSLLNKIKNGMIDSSNGWLDFKAALTGMMWWSDWFSLVEDLLCTRIKAAVAKMKDSSLLAVITRHPHRYKNSSFQKGPTHHMVESVYGRENAYMSYAKLSYVVHELEPAIVEWRRQITPAKRLASAVLGPPLGLASGLIMQFNGDFRYLSGK